MELLELLQENNVQNVKQSTIFYRKFVQAIHDIHQKTGEFVKKIEHIFFPFEYIIVDSRKLNDSNFELGIKIEKLKEVLSYNVFSVALQQVTSTQHLFVVDDPEMLRKVAQLKPLHDELVRLQAEIEDAKTQYKDAVKQEKRDREEEKRGKKLYQDNKFENLDDIPVKIIVPKRKPLDNPCLLAGAKNQYVGPPDQFEFLNSSNFIKKVYQGLDLVLSKHGLPFEIMYASYVPDRYASTVPKKKDAWYVNFVMCSRGNRVVWRKTQDSSMSSSYLYIDGKAYSPHTFLSLSQEEQEKILT